MNRLRTRLRASIADGPLVLLDFISGGLDPRITFTRGSNATLVDSTGKITYAPANLLTWSQDFDNAFWVKTAATVTANTTVAPDGTTTADTLTEDTTAVSAHRILTTVSVAAAAHTASIYVKAGTRSWFYIRLTDSGAVQRYAYFNVAAGTLGTVETNLTASITDAGNGWYRCAATVNVAATSLPVIYAITDGNNSQVYTGNGTGSLFYWGAQLEPVTYQTTPSTYVATTSAAYYGPRFDYDPVTLAAKGLLIEEQRVNAMLQSQTLETTWTRGNILAFGSGSVVNAIAAPDGTTTADFIVPDTTGGVAHFMAQAVVHTAASHTISAYVKAGAYSKFAFRENTTLGTYATFNIGIGAVIETNGTASIQNAGNGWYRCTLTYTGAAASQNMGLYVLPAAYTSGSPHLYLWSGDGTSGLYMWGVQDELGAFPTSYIPTVASQVTRNADVATMTGTNFSSWYNQSEGTFVCDADTADANTANRSIYFAANAGGTDIVYGVAGTLRTIRVLAGGVTTGEASAGIFTNNVPAKTAGAYKVNDFAASFNGGTVAIDTSGAVPTTVDRLTLGTNTTLTASSYLNGHIRSIAYYNTRLPNAQLQTLTAPSLGPTLTMSFTNQAYTVGV
jgi:hypothetical protein